MDRESYIRRYREDRRVRDKTELILELCAGREVLDIGCVDHGYARSKELGSRWLHGQIREVAGRCVGLDIDAEAVARHQADGLDLRQGDAESARLGEAFDVVVVGDLIEHVANPGRLLETVAEHLKDGGQAVITTPNPLSIHRIFTGFFDGAIGINDQHCLWLDPHTSWELVARSPLEIREFHWIRTGYPAWIQNPWFRFPFNRVANFIAARRPLLRLDFALVLARRAAGR